MKYLSVCSGIEAATVAWHPLGWTPAAFSEIETFPRAVLQHHYPEVPLHGDFTTIGGDEYGAIDLLVGGTPCQSFSIAGLRGGLDDERGNLALEFLRLADRTGARWLVWENVPGVLSSNGGRDFGSILGGMVELGYGIAYRVLDAQHFGVPQRRRRVFVVGYLGDWRRAAAVLFERHGLQGHPAPRREAREAVAALTANGVGTCGADDNQGQAGHLIAYCGEVSRALTACHTATGRLDPNEMEFVAVADTLTGNGDAHSGYRDEKGLVAYSIMPMNSGKDYKARETDVAQPVMAGGPVGGNQGGDFVKQASAVRRLTPRECERLQGFPDDYTLIPWRGKPAELCPDGPRYKALGNSMAVPVMRWIGERIAMVEALEPASERIAA
jgi:DNA (cytosine-5)-methyltransferase 1